MADTESTVRPSMVSLNEGESTEGLTRRDQVARYFKSHGIQQLIEQALLKCAETMPEDPVYFLQSCFESNNTYKQSDDQLGEKESQIDILQKKNEQLTLQIEEQETSEASANETNRELHEKLGTLQAELEEWQAKWKDLVEETEKERELAESLKLKLMHMEKLEQEKWNEKSQEVDVKIEEATKPEEVLNDTTGETLNMDKQESQNMVEVETREEKEENKEEDEDRNEGEAKGENGKKEEVEERGANAVNVDEESNEGKEKEEGVEATDEPRQSVDVESVATEEDKVEDADTDTAHTETVEVGEPDESNPVMVNSATEQDHKPNKKPRKKKKKRGKKK